MRTRRLRDHLANLLHLSATEAGIRIATAADLARKRPALPETAAAARHGLLGAEHLRIIRDTIAKLPDTATAADRARFDLELAGVAIAERPEVLRRDAALLLADYDATCDDPIIRERSRAARREFVLGPQDADCTSRGRFCLDPEGARLPGDRFSEAGPAGHVQPHRPDPVGRRRPRSRRRQWRHPDRRTTQSRRPSKRPCAPCWLPVTSASTAAYR